MVDQTSNSDDSAWRIIEYLLSTDASPAKLKRQLEFNKLLVENFRYIPGLCERLYERDADTYDMVCIGGDAVAYSIADGTSQMGGKALVIETSDGSTAMLRTFSAIGNKMHQIRTGGQFGLITEGKTAVDFGKVMAKVRQAYLEVKANNQSKSIDVLNGLARFSGPNSLVVAGKQIKFRNACICPSALTHFTSLTYAVPYVTPTTLWSDLVDQPKSMLIVGGSPIACEIGQAF